METGESVIPTVKDIHKSSIPGLEAMKKFFRRLAEHNPKAVKDYKDAMHESGKRLGVSEKEVEDAI